MIVTDEMVERAHKALPLLRQYYVGKDDIRDILGSLPDAPAPEAVVVKALEWREHPKKSNGCWTADSPFGTYSVVNEGGWWCVLEDGPFGKGFEWLGNDLSKDTLETAKAAAQADYERRIRSALVPTPAPVKPTEAWLGEGAGKHKWAPIMDGTLCCQYCMIDQAASTSDECSKAPRTVTHPAPSGQLVEVVWLGEGAGFKSFTRRKTIAEAWQRDGLKVTPVYARATGSE